MFHLLVEVLTIAAIIGAAVIAVLLIKNKYQPEIERTWENSKEQEEEQKSLLLLSSDTVRVNELAY
jgi:capsular polysaccharide biosynthesis protein